MTESKPIKILVTGGMGFIGTNICLEALERGYEVVALDNLSRSGSETNAEMLNSLGVGFLQADITCCKLDSYMEGVDCVIHLAGQVGVQTSIDNPSFDFSVNAYGTFKVLEAARKSKSAVIFASTNKVYSESVNDVPIKESETRYFWDKGIDESFRTDGKHHTPYGLSKLTGDMYCQEYFTSFGVKTVVNRMSCIYGEFQNGAEEQGWVDHFIRSNLFNDGLVNIYGDGKQLRDVLWGRDVAKLYLNEFENIDLIAGEVFNVGGGINNTMSLIECMGYIEGYSGIPFKKSFKEWRQADQKVYTSDISKVSSKLGWRPLVSPQEGIRRMIDTYLQR